MNFLPVYQMGYGSRALQLLQMYYEGKFPTMDESTGLTHSEITSVASEVIQPKAQTETDTSISPEYRGKCKGQTRKIERMFNGKKLPRCCLL